MVPESPSLEDARRALDALTDPFSDFPFVRDEDRAAAIAAVLSIVGRPAIDGPVPLFGIRAPTPGTGKGLLAFSISLIGTGRVPSLMAVARDDEEMRKRILSIGIEGTPVVLIDNVEGSLGSSALAAALTSTTFSDRLLGVNRVVRVPLHTVWLATGNGLAFKGDLGRRVVPIDLDAAVEHPEDLEGFRYPDLMGHIREVRPSLLTEALTILRAFHVAGRPSHGKSPLGSFEAWDGLVRSACIWVGLADPTGGRSRLRRESDDDLDQIRGVYVPWHEAFGETAMTLAEVIADASREGSRAPGLRPGLAALDPRGDGSKLNARAIASRFRKWRGRIVGGLRLEKLEDLSHGAALWRIVPVSNPESAGGEFGGLGESLSAS